VLFSSKGTVYVMRVGDVPATTGYGEPVQSLLKFGDGERVVVARLIREPDKSPAASTDAQPALPGIIELTEEVLTVLVATAKGYGFRATPDLTETTRAGRRLARVGDGDEIVSVDVVSGPQVVVATAAGKMVRFALEEVPELAGPGRGVILMKPDKGDDRIVGALALGKKDELVAVTPDGGERRIPVADVPTGKRAQKGQKVVKRGGVASIKHVEAEA
jgi:DNA gyrase subunit A